MRKYALIAVIVAAPVLLFAFASGPIPGRAGVPGEGNCSMCHMGTSVGTSMTIAASDGNTYTPGTAKTITITITDSHNVYGFQATARAAADAKAQVGAFAAEGSYRIRCANADLADLGTNKPATGCPATHPLEYIEHASPSNSNTFTFTWTPPESATGDVILYAAGNAANGNGVNTGDRIHTATLTLTAGAAGGPPAISEGGAVTVINFGGSTSTAPQSWLEIYGTNLAASTADWTEGIGSGTAPTEIAGTSVQIGGQPAFLSYVSPGQVNAQVPDGIGAGPTTLTVQTAAGTSGNYTIQVAAVNPSLFAPPILRVNSRQYVGALHDASTYVGPPGFVDGLTFRTAVPGDVITIYAVGLGEVSPAQAAGEVTPDTPTKTIPNISLTFGDQPVTLQFAGLTPQAVGLYQLNAVVPNVPAGDYEIRGTINGVAIPAGLFINLQ